MEYSDWYKKSEDEILIYSETPIYRANIYWDQIISPENKPELMKIVPRFTVPFDLPGLIFFPRKAR